MSVTPVSADQPDLLALIAIGDPHAVAGFFDARAPRVREYCCEVCPPEQVDQATLAAFVDFLGRIRTETADADLDALLDKSTRTAAASRITLSQPHEPACRSIPQLIAARSNSELPHDEEPINRHLERCAGCQRTAERLAQAEAAMTRAPTGSPPDPVRVAWLEIGARQATSSVPSAPVGSPERSEQGVGSAWIPAAEGSTSAPSEQVSQEPANPWISAPPAIPAASEAPGEPRASGGEERRSEADESYGLDALWAPVTSLAGERESHEALQESSAPPRPAEPESVAYRGPAPEPEPTQVPTAKPAVPSPPTPERQTIRVRHRRGGLVGTAKRLLSPPREQ